MTDQTPSADVDQTITPDELSTQLPSELDSLKVQADRMGIAYPRNITVETLRKKVTEALQLDTPVALAKRELTEAEVQQAEFAQIRDNALKLVRVLVTPMDSTKKEYQGEIITVSNAVIGTVKKYVLFNEPYHIENVILEQLREKKCQVFVTRKTERGQQIREGKLINAYAIEVLAPLTKEELAALAKDQAARQVIV